MVLNIALEGIDGVGKTTQIQRLEEFFKNKDYTVKTITQPHETELMQYMKQHTLDQHEIALIMAADRSITLNQIQPEDYDIIFWDRSILSSYAYNTNETVDDKFITDINRYFPEMDLYIIIENSQILDNPDYSNYDDHQKIIRKYQRLHQENPNIVKVPYIPGEKNQVFENIVVKIFEELPKCGWCGRLFTRTNKYRKYCCENCSKNARKDQNRIHSLKYYYTYKELIPERLGSYGANLHSHKCEDNEKEHQLIQNEKKRLGI